MQNIEPTVVPHRTVFPIMGDLSSVEGLVDAVRRILLKSSASVQSIHISTNAGVVVDWDGAPGDEMALNEERVDLHQMLYAVPMDEVDGSDAAKALGTAATLAEASGSVITHALVGTKSLLWRWLDAEDLARRPTHVGGGLIHSSAEITRDELFLFAGPASAAPPESSTRVTRILMETK